MRLGIFLRVSGPDAGRDSLLRGAQAADRLGLDDVWVFDHLAIPREESEGSDGYYLEALAALAFLAGGTERVGLGTAVLILPYRPPLLTAKWAATLQVLSNDRLRLGVGAGWMEAEFRALGVAHERRGEITDETLAFFRRAFDNDECEANGQKFLFRPRPARPTLLIGGASDAALRRTVRFGDGWLPLGLADDVLEARIRSLRELSKEAGRAEPEVVFATRLPTDDVSRGRQRLANLAALGVGQVVHMPAARELDSFEREAEALARLSG